MKIIAIEKQCPNLSPEYFTDALKKSEAARVWELYQSGALREIYFRFLFKNAISDKLLYNIKLNRDTLGGY